MEEKKLTDEEVVKALECCSNGWACKNCKCDKENNNRFICSENLMKDCLDLIHRLQAETERLTEENKELEESCELFKEFNTKLCKRIDELQKQVDEFMEENQKLQNYNDKLSQGIYYGNGEQFCNRLKQAVKDTAKEILQELYEYPHEYHEKKILEIARRKGVEVD